MDVALPVGVRLHVDGPLVYGAETAALIVAVVSLALLPGLSERCLLVWERAGWCTERPLGSGCERGVRRVERDGGACPGRLGTGDGIVCGCGAAVGGGTEGVDGVLAICWTMAVCAAMQPFYFPDVKILGAGLEVVCRAIAVLAFLELLRSRWGRIGIGPFLFGAGLLTLNLNWPPFTSHIPSEAYLLAEAMFWVEPAGGGAGGLAVALAPVGGAERAERHHCARPESCAHDADRAGTTEGVVGAKAAWFQWMVGERMVPTQHSGLSAEFLRALGQLGRVKPRQVFSAKTERW